MKLLVAAAVPLAALLLGTGVAHAAPPPNVPGAVCKILGNELTGDPAHDQGTFDAVAEVLSEKYGLSDQQAAIFVAGSIQDHCPQYRANLDAAIKYAKR